jgi:hypothetical protein
LLLVITYLDRVCISVAGPRMQEALNIGPLAWGWVTGIFTLSYAAFEIPCGALGDRIGPRRVALAEDRPQSPVDPETAIGDARRYTGSCGGGHRPAVKTPRYAAGALKDSGNV